ncbi:hypothetical protein [Actinomycetospora termitidis]|uniref:Uncharacterized protein n=1 Tax=Actinomycetospora termitidis TaxID=3053470 RepID=A0ABT7M3N5_9PSEU|nr:hypothetical protein [Actinomycetospora sp. Odt1-22]MDL5154617.1 hypothetical protein [Actinomycetospora sp. Odt1-22]
MASRRSSSSGLGTVIGVVLLVGLAILILKWALITAAILAVPFGAWWVHDQVQQRKVVDRRTEVEGRAVVDAAGGCGWCGSRIAHRDDYTGSLVLPADHHRDEIEAALAG